MKTLLLGFALAAAAAGASDPGVTPLPDAAPEPDLPPPGEPPPADQVDDITRRIGAGLRCPVCQGLSIADSPSETAVAMKNRVHELVAQGYDEDQIRDYFVARYGEWILLEPRAQGVNWLVWLAPGIMGGVGLAVASSIVVRWRREVDPVPLPSDQGLVAKDPYEQRLLAEIEDD